MKVISKKIKSKVDFSKYFNQMLGLEDIPGEFISYKYEQIMRSCEDFVKIWEMILGTDIFKVYIQKKFQKGFLQIEEFIKNSNEELKKIKVFPKKSAPEKNIKEINETLLKLSQKYDEKELNAAYKEIKKSKTLEHLFVTYEKLKSLLKSANNDNPTLYINDKNYNVDFIIESAEDTQILSFSNIEFKSAFNFCPEKFIPLLTSTVMPGFRITYLEGENAYNQYISPDIDVESFCASFVEKIADLKKHIKGCRNAFSAIEKSIKLLEKNFPNYYKKFVTTKNPSVIFEDFLTDVADKNKNNLSISTELSKIIKEIKVLLQKTKSLNKDTEQLINFADSIIEKLNTSEESN